MTQKEIELLTEIRDILKKLLKMVEEQKEEQEMAKRVFKPELKRG